MRITHDPDGRRFILCIAVLLLSCVLASAGNCDVPSPPPLVVVYGDKDAPIDYVTVAVTNPRKDVAIQLTSLEFEGQLPELRYFLHGVYGHIWREGANYEHSEWSQELSRPVSTCFLLPGQSASWKRPMRVRETGYRANVQWWEVRTEDLSRSVWFESHRKERTLRMVYVPLSQDQEDRYSNIAAGKGIAPKVILEGQFACRAADVDVPHTLTNWGGFAWPADAPEGSVRLHIEPISDAVLVTPDRAVLQKFNWPLKQYEDIASPDISTNAVDFIYLCLRKPEKTIPCILDPNTFGDLVEVKRPFTQMYYDPGITEVPAQLFRKILDRAQERSLPVRLKIIDPNSLGGRYVIVCGVEIDDAGRELGIREPQTEAPGRTEPKP